MSVYPDAAVSPLAQAPPDRPTRDFEQLTQQWLAMLLRDGGIDEYEMQIVRSAFRQIMLVIQQRGGLQQGAVPPGQGQEPMPPGGMNENVQDWGDGQGEPMEAQY
jgi:hypothetical protein